MMRYIGEHLQYPETALKSGKQGKCVLRFVITKDGNVGEVKVLRSVSAQNVTQKPHEWRARSNSRQASKTAFS